jgi:hypothetical protein
MANVSLTQVSTNIPFSADAYFADISANGLVVSYKYFVPGSETLLVKDQLTGVQQVVAVWPSQSFPGFVFSGIEGGELSAGGRVIFFSYGILDGSLSPFQPTRLFVTDLQSNVTVDVTPPYDPLIGGLPVAPNLPAALQGLLPVDISGDGTRILYGWNYYDFSHTFIDYDGVFVQDTTSGIETTVVARPDQSVDLFLEPLDLTPDARYATYVTGYQDGHSLYLVDLQAHTASKIATNVIARPDSLSDDGRYVAYGITYQHLGSNSAQIYLHDRQNPLFSVDRIISSAADGTPGNGNSTLIALSGDGHHVAFVSSATNLVPNDTNGVADIFIKNLDTGHVTRVVTGVGTDGVTGALSFDGSTLVYDSTSNGGIASDTDGKRDVFVVKLLPPVLTINAITGDDRVNAVEAAGSIVVSGTSDAIGQVVTILGPNNTVPRFATVQSNGAWSTSFNVAGLADGSYSYTASVSDDAGITQSTTRSFAIDRVAPALAISSVASDNVVNAAEAPLARITGTSDAIGATVLVTLDGVFKGSGVVAADGTWTAFVIASGITDGPHVIGASVADVAGNRATASKTAVIDTTPPQLAITSVSGDDVVNATEAAVPQLVIGTSDALGQTVSVTLDGVAVGTATVQADGSWSKTLSFASASPGQHQVSASVTDAAGNVTTDAEQVLVDSPAVVRISTTASGQQGAQTNGFFFDTGLAPSVSGDGRYVVFYAFSPGLVPGESQSFYEVYLKDTQTGAIKIISANAAGVPGNGNSGRPVISADGHFAAFFSSASNLVSDDTNNVPDLFVVDLTTGAITRGDVDANGVQANNAVSSQFERPAISADGRFVAFTSFASNLVPGTSTVASRVYVKDMQTGAVTLVAEGNAREPTISADGRFVAYTASSPKSDGSNGDVYVKDLVTGIVTLVSANASGAAGNSASFRAQISPDGHLIVFGSSSTNLTPGGDPGLQAYVKNLETGVVTIASLTSTGAFGNAGGILGNVDFSFSGDSRFLAFSSTARLTPDDPDTKRDVYVKDLLTGEIRLITTGTVGLTGVSSDGELPSLSWDGSYIVFEAGASDLVAGDTNGVLDIFETQLIPHTVAFAPVTGDNAINAAELSASLPISGSSSAIGGSVKVLVDGVQVGTSTVAANGTWSSTIDTTTLAQGSHNLVASVTDGAGRTASGGAIVQLDTLAPTVKISSDKTHVAAGETATITFTFNEPITSVNDGDVVVTGGTLGPLSFVNSHTLAAVFTPAAGVHAATIQLEADAVSDLALNFNTASSLVLGLAIDGYIAGATVFMDSNFNDLVDAGEGMATTGADGSFMLSGASGPLVLHGGVDTATGLPFQGTLMAPAGFGIITPITTLIVHAQHANPSMDIVAVVQAILKQEYEENIDNLKAYITQLGDLNQAKAQIRHNLEIMNAATLAATALAAADPTGLLQKSQAFDVVMAEIANELLTGAADIDSISLQQVMQHAAASLNLTSSVLDKVADATSKINQNMNDATAVATAGLVGVEFLTTVNAVALVAQGMASDAVRRAVEIISGPSYFTAGLASDQAPTDLSPPDDPSDPLADVVAQFSGSALLGMIAAAEHRLADVDGPAFQSAPVAVADGFTIAADGALVVEAAGVLANDFDSDGDSLAAVLASNVSHGTLTLNLDGSFTYTPSPGYSGPDSFTYKANDGTADSNVVTVSIVVEPASVAPVADDDSYTTALATVLEVAGPGVLDGDTDANGDVLKVAEIVTAPAHGTLEARDDGSFTYIPAAGFSGSDSFSYRAFDGEHFSNIATVTINVDAGIDVPAPSTPDLAAEDDTGDPTDNVTSRASVPTFQASDLTFNGTAAAGATVRLFSLVDLTGDGQDNDGDGVIDESDEAIYTELGSGVATNGAYTIDIDLPAGITTVVAQAELAGVTSPYSAGLDVTVEFVEVPAPSVPDLAAEDDTGDPTDNITSQASALTFTGTAAAGATVTLYAFVDQTGDGQDNDGDGAIDESGEGVYTALGSAVATNGAYAIDIDLPAGTTTVVARAALAGGTSPYSAGLDVTVAVPAPSAPDLAAEDDTGDPTDNVTSQASALTFTGTAAAGATVTLYAFVDQTGDGQDNDGDGAIDESGEGVYTALGSAVATNGAYAIDIDLPAGITTVVARAELAGGTSPYSAGPSVTVEPPAGSVAISNLTITEGNAGAKLAVFTLTRTNGTAAFDVGFSTANGTALAGSDYVATAGTAHFAAGQSTAQVSVTINGDTSFEPDESFFVNLSGATNGATITDGQALGTITNDDAEGPVLNAIDGTPGNDRNLVGTGGADQINGLAGNDDIEGNGGNDVIIAGAGRDWVSAGRGNDIIVATINDGNDIYNGDSGSDTFDFSQITAPVTVNLGTTIFRFTLDGVGYATGEQIGTDILLSIENVIGGSGNDTITGDNLANVIEGGAGNDIMEGRGGADTFVFKLDFGNDRITGFDADPAGGQDHLDISAFGIDSASFAARVTITDVGADTLVTIDGQANQTIRLVGMGNATTITAADFLL